MMPGLVNEELTVLAQSEANRLQKKDSAGAIGEPL